ncbi:MAG TPA: GntR family transcriptional regulator [Pseudolysinimonas sp.]|nr:GntR family transcriptional regulator [Pseudolysinimonas sp.]
MSTTPATMLPGSISDALRADIIAQRELPGAAITESAVALRFGVARPTAKIAIERLVAQGLLRRSAHQAARVPELGRDDIVDLFRARSVIESAAIADLAVAGTIPADALAAHRAMLADADGDFAAADIAFHRALVAATPTTRLARMHEQLMGEIELAIGQVQARRLLSRRAVAEQHQGILDAVVVGDAALAARLTDEHIARSRDVLIAEHPTPDPEGRN